MSKLFDDMIIMFTSEKRPASLADFMHFFLFYAYTFCLEALAGLLNPPRAGYVEPPLNAAPLAFSLRCYKEKARTVHLRPKNWQEPPQARFEILRCLNIKNLFKNDVFCKNSI